MLTRQELKRNMLGCFEIFLFMSKGIERFKVDRRRAVASFAVPAMFLPFVLMVIVGLSDDQSSTFLTGLFGLVRIVSALALFLLVVYFLARQFDRQEHFYKFLIVSNWLNINSMILVAPILIGLALGIPAAQFEVYAVFITMVGYVYSAFALTHCFRMPWEMGGCVAIIGLAIDQNLFDLSDYALSVL